MAVSEFGSNRTTAAMDLDISIGINKPRKHILRKEMLKVEMNQQNREGETLKKQ